MGQEAGGVGRQEAASDPGPLPTARSSGPPASSRLSSPVSPAAPSRAGPSRDLGLHLCHHSPRSRSGGGGETCPLPGPAGRGLAGVDGQSGEPLGQGGSRQGRRVGRGAGCGPSASLPTHSPGGAPSVNRPPAPTAPRSPARLASGPWPLGWDVGGGDPLHWPPCVPPLPCLFRRDCWPPRRPHPHPLQAARTSPTQARLAPTVAAKQRPPPPPPPSAPDAALGGPGRKVGTGQWPGPVLHRPAPAWHQALLPHYPARHWGPWGRGWVRVLRTQAPPAPPPTPVP